MSMKTKTFGILIGLATAAAGAASADDVNPGVTVRGFVSQAYLKSSANRFLTVRTDEGRFAFTEAALNFTAQPLPRLRVAAQVFARDVGSQGNNRAVLDWGLGEYRALDQLGFRVGRIKFPVGLYNTLADADVTRPEIFQPGGVYPADRRDLTNAIDGAGLFGTINLRGAGYLEYEALYGSIDLDETYLLTRAARDTAAGVLPALAALPLRGADYAVNETSGNVKQSWGGYVEWHPRISGLRVRAGLQGADVELASHSTLTGFVGPAPVALNLRSSTHSKVPYQAVFSAEYSHRGLRLSAEHLRGKVETTPTLSGLPFPLPPPTQARTHPTSTYGQVAYRFNQHLQASGYYSVYYPDRDDKKGLALVRKGSPASKAWLKDFAFTLRVDVNAHWLAKVEVHRFDGTANLSTSENPAPLEQKWTLFAVKTTLHF
jgi:hypothetical protein